jgi:tRNA-2-methylthio-N6-dimethylallyladenosine synthase
MCDDVTPEEKTRRFRHLESVQRATQNVMLQRYLGSTVKVLAEKTSAKSGEHLSGHSTCHKVVNFKGPAERTGELFNVKIEEIKANSLFGEVC